MKEKLVIKDLEGKQEEILADVICVMDKKIHFNIIKNNIREVGTYQLDIKNVISRKKIKGE